jgi:hypothetical protein
MRGWLGAREGQRDAEGTSRCVTTLSTGISNWCAGW